MIPVQIVPCEVPVQDGTPQKGLCGTCTKCGKTATVTVSQTRADGTPRVRQYAAEKAVLAAITNLCAERLPWGLPPHHYDRDIPAGVEVFQQDVRGVELTCHVEEVGGGEVRRATAGEVRAAARPRGHGAATGPATGGNARDQGRLRRVLLPRR